MNPAAASVGDLVQHATVSVVALGALGVVLRRVFGVFGTRPAPRRVRATGMSRHPACSHCAAAAAAADTRRGD